MNAVLYDLLQAKILRLVFFFSAHSTAQPIQGDLNYFFAAMLIILNILVNLNYSQFQLLCYEAKSDAINKQRACN